MSSFNGSTAIAFEVAGSYVAIGSEMHHGFSMWHVGLIGVCLVALFFVRSGALVNFISWFIGSIDQTYSIVRHGAHFCVGGVGNQALFDQVKCLKACCDNTSTSVPETRKNPCQLLR